MHWMHWHARPVRRVTVNQPAHACSDPVVAVDHRVGHKRSHGPAVRWSGLPMAKIERARKSILSSSLPTSLDASNPLSSRYGAKPHVLDGSCTVRVGRGEQPLVARSKRDAILATAANR